MADETLLSEVAERFGMTQERLRALIDNGGAVPCRDLAPDRCRDSAFRSWLARCALLPDEPVSPRRLLALYAAWRGRGPGHCRSDMPDSDAMRLR